MSRVTALVPDLLFGSKVKAMLEQDGHEVTMVAALAQARERAAVTDVLVVDLTSPDVDGTSLVAQLGAAGPRTLAFYSHVDVDTKRAADAAGFDLVVPKSRMAREGAQLVARLSAPT